jgi:hypothetical protein
MIWDLLEEQPEQLKNVWQVTFPFEELAELTTLCGASLLKKN